MSFPAHYLGRLAPSPTGLLHLGHARTFWVASERSRLADGEVLLRNDDLDRARCRAEFVTAMQDDLAWLGLRWRPPMITQSERIDRYRSALAQLHAAGHLYPCTRSRRDVAGAAGAPHEGAGAEANDEPIYPREWRPPADAPIPALEETVTVNWRFRVSDDETVVFEDGLLGEQRAVAGRAFGDFLVWRKDDLPSYQLACAVDDNELGITEVVRGADLVQSTFRQILILRALHGRLPSYAHCGLMTDARGERLAKRHDSLSLRALRAAGLTPEEVRERFSGRLCP